MLAYKSIFVARRFEPNFHMNRFYSCYPLKSPLFKIFIVTFSAHLLIWIESIVNVSIVQKNSH